VHHVPALAAPGETAAQEQRLGIGVAPRRVDLVLGEALAHDVDQRPGDDGGDDPLRQADTLLVGAAHAFPLDRA
jgi:hypothetical protein